MNKSPYEVLGVSPDANEEQIKTAYRNLAKQYHPDNFSGNDTAEQMATEKMQELNEAYDTAMANLRGATGSGGGNGAFARIRQYINANRLAEADNELERIPASMRGAEWHYLKGTVYFRKGWVEQAASHFEFAANAEPNNAEYRSARDQINWQRNGNTGRAGQQGGAYPGNGNCCGGCSGCDMCTGLCCADTCCECMGGDLCSCC